ncbi:LOW QUALITY PROTEIN: arylsulfatase D-like [Synchiropus picturatus]
MRLQAWPLLGLLLLAAVGRGTTGEERKPNFVLIMVDDLGIGDVGCYGNNTIRTPNIDRLASEGVRLSQHIAAAPLCTPSRSAFMTGRYPLRSGMAGAGRSRVLMFLGGSGGLLSSETTFAKRLQQQGYSTGLVGKWHLGLNCEHRGDHCHHPNTHGFDYYYGIPFTLHNDCEPGEDSVVMTDLQETLRNMTIMLGIGLFTLVCIHVLGLVEISLCVLVLLFLLSALATAVWYVPFNFLPTWNCVLMRNQDVVEQPVRLETLPQRLLGEAKHFIQRNANRPFLLFFSLAHIHTPLFKNPKFAGKSQHGRYGDNMEELDWMIGEITDTVDSLGLAGDTLMYFTSDHGGHLEDADDAVGQKGGWNGIYRGVNTWEEFVSSVLDSAFVGGKAMGGWEGGIRVPGIFRWPGKLKAGRVVDEPTSLMDLYPTLTHLARDSRPDRPLDGYNLMPLLQGKEQRSEHEFMFHYCGVFLNAARWHPPDSDSIYKVHFFTPNFSPPGAIGCYNGRVCPCSGEHVTYHDPPLMFDLLHDPSESRPLTPYAEPRHAEVLAQLSKAVESHQRTFNSGQTSQNSGGIPNQMTWEKIFWRPWLQPCCGTFPFCGCREEQTAAM